jgi:hypothetical protein
MDDDRTAFDVSWSAVQKALRKMRASDVWHEYDPESGGWNVGATISGTTRIGHGRVEPSEAHIREQDRDGIAILRAGAACIREHLNERKAA